MHPERHDVCILGDDLVGCAVACALATQPGFDGSILVLDPTPFPAAASAPLTTAVLHQQWPTALNVAIARFGARALRRADRWLAINGVAPALRFRESGTLMLAEEDNVVERRMAHASAVCSGAEVAWLSPGELAERFPWMTSIDLEGATIGLSGEGVVDRIALLQALRAKAAALGVAFRADRVDGIDTTAREHARLRTGSEPDIECERLVNAAGPRAAAITRLTGLELPIHTRPRFGFTLDTSGTAPDLPCVVLPEGVRVQREGSRLRADWAPDPRDPADADHQQAETVFDRVVLPALARRIPACNSVHLRRAWIQHEDVHPLDGNPVLGPHPAWPNLLFAAGLSGHDALQAPALGQGLAEWIVHGAPRTLDLAPLDFRRVVAGEPFAGADG